MDKKKPFKVTSSSVSANIDLQLYYLYMSECGQNTCSLKVSAMLAPLASELLLIVSPDSSAGGPEG